MEESVIQVTDSFFLVKIRIFIIELVSLVNEKIIIEGIAKKNRLVRNLNVSNVSEVLNKFQKTGAKYQPKKAEIIGRIRQIV